MALPPLNATLSANWQGQSAVDAAQRGIAGTERTSKALGQTWANLTIIATGLKRTFQSLFGGFEDLLKSAEDQANAEIRLGIALKKTGADAMKELAALKEWSDARQLITTFADDVSLSLAAIGANFGITGDLLQRTVAAVQDQSIALGKDPESMMISLGKAFSGIGNDLGRLGIAFDETLPRAEAFEKAIKEMGGGLSEAIGMAPTSAWKIMKNAISEITESLGFLIVSTGTFQSLLRGITGFAGSLSKSLGDPATIRIWAKVIDDFVRSAIRGLAEFAATVIDVAAVLVQTGEVLRSVFGKERGTEIATTSASLDALATKVRLWGDATANAIGPGLQYVEVLKKIVDAASAQPGPSADQAAMAEQFRAQGTAMGQQYVDAFTMTAVAAFDSDIGTREAFKRLGDDVRNIFVGQMSGAAFDPIKQSLGALARVVAIPFQIVGNLIAGIVNQIVGFLVKAIAKILVEMGLITVAQETATAAGIAGMVAVNAMAVASGVAWSVPAVAASIATMGAALSFGPLAVAQVATGAAAIKGMAAIPAAAEGMVAMPSPGGSIVRVAEAGVPEILLPLDRAPDMLRDAMGSGAGGTTLQIYIDGFQAPEGDFDRHVDRMARAIQARIDEMLGGGRQLRGRLG